MAASESAEILWPATLSFARNQAPSKRTNSINARNTKAMTRVIIQWQDQFGHWQRFQEKHNEADAYRTAQARARSTGKRHRLIDPNGHLLDILEP